MGAVGAEAAASAVSAIASSERAAVIVDASPGDDGAITAGAGATARTTSSAAGGSAISTIAAGKRCHVVDDYARKTVRSTSATSAAI